LEKLKEKLEEEKMEKNFLKKGWGHSFNKKKICVKCGMSSIYSKAFKRPCSGTK
jgi:hypothetical protein